MKRPWFEVWASFVAVIVDVTLYVLVGGLVGVLVNAIVAAVAVGAGYGEVRVPMFVAISPTLLGVMGGIVSYWAEHAREKSEIELNRAMRAAFQRDIDELARARREKK